MTVGYRRFARPVGEDARLRRSIAQLVGGGANTDCVIDPFGTGNIILGAPVYADGECLYLDGDATAKLYFGAGQDAVLYYDGTNLLIDPDVVGSGVVVVGGSVTIGSGAAGVDYCLKFDGETNDGLLYWMEDEDYFQFSDCVKTAGGRKLATRAITDSDVVAATDEVIVCNKGSVMTLTLPDASGSGRKIHVKNINTGVVTVDGEGSDTIDGAATRDLNQWDAVRLVDYANEAWVTV